MQWTLWIRWWTNAMFEYKMSGIIYNSWITGLWIYSNVCCLPCMVLCVSLFTDIEKLTSVEVQNNDSQEISSQCTITQLSLDVLSFSTYLFFSLKMSFWISLSVISNAKFNFEHDKVWTCCCHLQHRYRKQILSIWCNVSAVYTCLGLNALHFAE